MEGFILFGAIAISALLWVLLQHQLVSAFGVFLGLLWALLVQLVATGAVFAIGQTVIEQYVPAKPGSWPAVSSGFGYMVDIAIYCLATLGLNAASAVAIAVIRTRADSHRS